MMSSIRNFQTTRDELSPVAILFQKKKEKPEGWEDELWEIYIAEDVHVCKLEEKVEHTLHLLVFNGHGLHTTETW